MVVATLNPTTDAADEALVAAYNTSVRHMVAAKAADGRRVVLADMSALTTADLNTDGVTPTTSRTAEDGRRVRRPADPGHGYGLDLRALRPGSPPNGSVCDIYAYYGTACVRPTA